jgi:hypothetical protein
LDLSEQSAANLTVKNSLVLNGTMFLGKSDGSTYAYVYFGDGSAAAQTLSGDAIVLMGGNANNALYNYNNGSGAVGTLTIASTVNLHGKSGLVNNLPPARSSIKFDLGRRHRWPLPGWYGDGRNQGPGGHERERCHLPARGRTAPRSALRTRRSTWVVAGRDFDVQPYGRLG